MGMDLTLLPLDVGREVLQTTDPMCRNALWMAADSLIFGQIIPLGPGEVIGAGKIPDTPTIPTRELPPAIVVNIANQSKRFIQVRRDGYDKPLRFAFAEDLKKLYVRPEAHHVNRAIKAYIDQLPDDTPVVLLWH